MYVELVEKSLSNRGNIIPMGEVGVAPAEFERYISLFPYTKDVYRHLKIKNSVRGYSGKQYCPMVYIDIDSEQDNNTALNTTISLIQHFQNEYSLNPDDLYIYFSGNKGFHIGILEQIFGKISPSENVPIQIKKLVEEISFKSEYIDTSIYDSTRIFRISNSLNKKSGLYKIQLNHEELAMGMDMIRDMSDTPRPDFKRNKPKSEIQLNTKLSEKWDLINKGYTGYFKAPEQGSRNTSLYNQACMLFDKSTLSRKDISDIIHNINSGLDSPLSIEEISRIIENAYTKTGKDKQRDDLVVKTFAECIHLWYDSILPEFNKMSLVFPELDKEFQGKLRGKLAVILGKGGSKKSLMSQNISYQNIFKNHCRILYSTMEMPISELISRYIDMVISDAGENASKYLERRNYKEEGFAREYVQKHVMPMYSDKLLISDSGGVTAADYDKMLMDATERYGKIDMLIPDGLSMMKGSDKEMEAVNRHTAELKTLAIKWGIFIPAIVHVTKEPGRDTKDLTAFARASEKIMDNCDFSISMSLIEENGGDIIGETQKYRTDRGHIQVWNKRGSGRWVDLDFLFDENRLLMSSAAEISEQDIPK